jgi:putative DNA methylase
MSDAGKSVARARVGERERPRLLIEESLPAAAIGVECIRERSTGQQPPDKRLHVWWARRPLVASRAAVLGSLLPADFPRDVFERLLGFWGRSTDIVEAERFLNHARLQGIKVPNPHGGRAFNRGLREKDLEAAHEAACKLWGAEPIVLDPMAGGGSIPLESTRLGFSTLANEYNPVACSVLEATTDYPFRFGPELADRARAWGMEVRRRFNARIQKFFPSPGLLPRHTYIYTRTVPCPDTGFHTPLVPDWHLLKPKTGTRVVAVPVVDKSSGTWRVEIREIGSTRGQILSPPAPTYKDGIGISLFMKGRPIPPDYIKAKAQAGEMRDRLYAVAVKTPQGFKFEPPRDVDLKAIAAAEAELGLHRRQWEKENILPTEERYRGDCDRCYVYGLATWASLFSSRQLLGMGILVDELRTLRTTIQEKEGIEKGAAIEHLLAFVIDKLLNYNATLASWHAPHAVMRSVFDRHDFSFKATFAEMAPCVEAGGLEWAIGSTLDAWRKLAGLSRAQAITPAAISLSSATQLPQIPTASISAVVVDPPYDDNVQYAELADFFYVWLKRTQGHSHPEWFATKLCEYAEEAVVNISRFRREGEATAVAKLRARERYRQLMTATFKECWRVLDGAGVLTVMFTHKKQEAWEALFRALIDAGFTITATWPVKTESEHSLHQAKKNAAQSTVILVARKRRANAGVGFYDREMKAAIRDRARASAERLRRDGLNPVDQLVGSFGPALEIYSRYDEVRTDIGERVGVDRAIDEASDAVSLWRIEQLAAQGLGGVEGEGRFALLCWDVLGAAEFRFNEAKLLGHAVGMDVETLVAAGLVTKESDKVRILSARQRRRERPLEPDERIETLFGSEVKGRRRRKVDVLKVHPNDSVFRTALDGCHALALRYMEAGGGGGGIGAARALVRQQGWRADSGVARLMGALVQAAPEAVRREKGAKSAAAQFPEFRAWHVLLQPLFGLPAPDWTEKAPPQLEFELKLDVMGDSEDVEEDAEDDEEDTGVEDG